MIDDSRAQEEMEPLTQGMLQHANIPPLPDVADPRAAERGRERPNESAASPRTAHTDIARVDEKSGETSGETSGADKNNGGRQRTPVVDALATLAELPLQDLSPADAVRRALMLALPHLPSMRVLGVYVPVGWNTAASAAPRQLPDDSGTNARPGQPDRWLLLASSDGDTETPRAQNGQASTSEGSASPTLASMLTSDIPEILAKTSQLVQRAGVRYSRIYRAASERGILAAVFQGADVSGDDANILRALSAALGAILARRRDATQLAMLGRTLDALATLATGTPEANSTENAVSHESRGAGSNPTISLADQGTKRRNVVRAVGYMLAELLPTRRILALMPGDAPEMPSTLETIADPSHRLVALDETTTQTLIGAVKATYVGTHPLPPKGQQHTLAVVRDLLRSDDQTPPSLLLVRVGDAQAPEGMLLAPWTGGELDDHIATLTYLVAALGQAQLAALAAVVTTEEQARAFDVFLSLAAHELRSPLTSVKGYGQLLLRQAGKYQLPERVVHSAESIVQQSERLAEMIDEVHDAARIRRNRLELAREPVDLVAVTQRVLVRLQHEYPRHHVEFTPSVEAAVGIWDAQRVMQCVRAVIDNALRFSPEGGTIRATLRAQATKNGREAVLCVRDPGVGIRPEEQEHVYSYLYRGPSAEQRNLAGLGLGLYVARATAHMLGGRLWLTWTSADESASTPTGSEFCLALPLQPEADHEH